MLIAALLATSVLAVIAAPGAGAAVTIGSGLASVPAPGNVCASGQTCAFFQTALPGRTVTVPSDGVVVRWRSRVSFSTPPNRSGTLRALRSTGGGSYLATVHSSTVTLANGAVGTYSTQLSVKAGDLIGMSATYSSVNAFRSGVTGATAGRYSSPLNDGASGTALIGPSDLELLVNADIEPDADLDGYGDETQDLCPSDGTRHDSCTADLQVTTTASASGIGLLTDLTFFVKVKNTGPQNKANSVTMSDQIPALMRVDAVKADRGTCTAGQTVTCALGDLDINATATIRIDATGIKRGAVHTVASATSTSPDPNSANNVANADTAVLNPGACGNTKSGGGGHDSLTGTAAGDSLIGGGGNDTLRAGAGYDCLYGGAGDDRLYGESADDRLWGGAGNDHLDGGSEVDTYSAGPGNDVIDSRDNLSEKVNCGAGRDRVTADRKDKLTSCELGGSKKKAKRRHKRKRR